MLWKLIFENTNLIQVLLPNKKKLKLDIFSLKKVEKCDIEKKWQH